MNKYAFTNTIHKKWLENHIDPTKNLNKSTTFVYCNEVDVLVLMVRASVETPPWMEDFRMIMRTKCQKS
jgi:hypothetical protein